MAAVSVRTFASDSAKLTLGGLWVLVAAVTDSTGCPVDVVPAVTVTAPDGTDSSPAAETVAMMGLIRCEILADQPGRWIAVMSTPENGAATFAAYVSEPVPASAMPTIVDLLGDPEASPPVVGYLDENSWTDAQVQDALDAEAQAQRDVCRVPADYTPALRQALLRRVWRNLILRGQPALTIPGADDGSATILPAIDAEVRRFEGPYRRLVTG